MMRNIRAYLTVFVVSLATAMGIFSLATTKGHGQSQNQKTDTGVKPTVLVTDRAVNSAVPSVFATAAAQNGALRSELAWTFGSKPQHGWYLYDSLISQLLKTQADATSTDFAAALADWQKTAGINPTGILDEASLMAIVAGWQSNRFKDRTPALPEQLITAPPSDFFDPERLPELRQMTPETYAAYKPMIASALADSSLKLAHISNSEL